MSKQSRLDALYDSHNVNVTTNNRFCDIHITENSKLISSIEMTNQSLNNWFNNWSSVYDTDVSDISLSTVYDENKIMFKELQTILNDQQMTFNDIKNTKITGSDTIGYTYGSDMNQTRTLRGKVSYGTISNLATDVSLSQVIDLTSDIEINTNHYLVKHYYQIGMFNKEDIVIDLLNGDTLLKVLFDRVINSTNNIVTQNQRLIKSLQFNIDRCNGIKLLLTYIKN